MRRIAIAAWALICVGGTAGATTLCGTDNPRNTTSINAGGGCVAGGLLFSDFQYMSAAGNPAPEVDLVSAAVDQMGTVNLTFNPNMSAPPGGSFQDLYFMFSVTGGVNQVDLSVGGINATINETVCATAMNIASPSCSTGNTLANIVAFSAPPGPNTVMSSVFPTMGKIFIFKDIGVSPSSPNGGGGALTSFTQSFHIGLPSDVPEGSVPEPVSSSLIGSGLLGCFAFRKLRRSK